MDNYGESTDKYVPTDKAKGPGHGMVDNDLFFEYEQAGRVIRAYQDDQGYTYTLHRDGREVYRMKGKRVNLHEALETDDPGRARRIIHAVIGPEMEGILRSGFSEAEDMDGLVEEILEILTYPDTARHPQKQEGNIISYPYHGGLVFMDDGRRVIGVSNEGHLEDALREYDVIVDGCIDIDESYMLQDPGGVFHYILRVLSHHARPIWVLSERGRVYDKFKEKGLIVSEGLRSANALRTLLNHMKQRRILTVRYGYDKPGLYWDDGKIIKVHLNTSYDDEGLREALLTLEEYIADLPEPQRGKAYYLLLYHLTSPFDYIRREWGEPTHITLLYGPPRTGKTSLAMLIGCLWRLKDGYSQIGGFDERTGYYRKGEHADTVPRLAGEIGKWTLPTLIDEAEPLLEDRGLLNILKGIVDSPTARKTMSQDNLESKEYHALSTPILTMNEPPKGLTSHQGLIRRLKLIEFTEEDQHEGVKAEKFMEKWGVSERGRVKLDSRLWSLKHLGGWIIGAIIDDPNLLLEDRIRVSEKLLRRAYLTADLDYDDSILSDIRLYEPLSTEDIAMDEVDRVRLLIHEMVNRESKVHITRVGDGVYNDEYMDRPEDRFREVAESYLIPWLKWRRIKDEGMYLITRDILRDIRDKLGVSMTLAELSRRLDKAIIDADVEYGSVRRHDKDKANTDAEDKREYMRVVKIPEEAFIDWVLQRSIDKSN